MYKENGSGLDLDFLIISYLSGVLYPRRSEWRKEFSLVMTSLNLRWMEGNTISIDHLEYSL